MKRYSRVTFYQLLAWTMAIAMFAIFVVSLATGLLPTSYALLALGASILSCYLGVQLRRVPWYRRRGLKETDPHRASKVSSRYPPLSRVVLESAAVAAITLATALESESLGPVLLVYITGVAVIAIIETIAVARRRIE